SCGLPEVRRGLVPGLFCILCLSRLLPYYVVMDVLLTSDMIAADCALAFCFVDVFVEPGSALDSSLILLENIAAIGRLAERVVKQVVTESQDWRTDDMFALQNPRMTHIFASEDAKEGATAFAEKRPPVWKGR